jgi:hypothetical protein
MPLGTTEQVIYDYITTNQDIRDYWVAKIAELQTKESDEHAIASKLEELLVSVYLLDEEGLKDVEPLINRIDAMTCSWISIAFMLMGIDLQKKLIESAKAPTRSKGTKENPIPILSASYTGVSLHARSAIDRLFGEGNWTSPSNYGDIHGLRCWNVFLKDGTQEEVWFDYSPAAALVARREAGEKVGILDNLPQEERDKLHDRLGDIIESISQEHRDNLYVESRVAEYEAQYLKTLRSAVENGEADKRPEPTKKEGVTATTGCLTILAVMYMVIVSETLWQRLAWLIGGFLLVGIVTQAVNAIEKRLRKQPAKPATARERIEAKIVAAYSKFKELNPNSTFNEEAFRADWLKRNKFPENF